MYRTYTEMIEIINEEIVKRLSDFGFEDTPENRTAALEGLIDGWKESDGDTPEAQPWITAASLEKLKQSMKCYKFFPDLK